MANVNGLQTKVNIQSVLWESHWHRLKYKFSYQLSIYFPFYFTFSLRHDVNQIGFTAIRQNRKFSRLVPWADYCSPAFHNLTRTEKEKKKSRRHHSMKTVFSLSPPMARITPSHYDTTAVTCFISGIAVNIWYPFGTDVAQAGSKVTSHEPLYLAMWNKAKLNFGHHTNKSPWSLALFY